MKKYVPHNPTEKSFLNDVRDHQLVLFQDQGVYRHLRFSRPETSNMYFSLLTWPGHLCICGDMGTFVFSRIPDMFEFFRSGIRDEKLEVNLGYWSEKLDAIDKGGAEKFCPDKFKHRVYEFWRESEEYLIANAKQRKEIWQDIERCVLSTADDGEHFAYQAAAEFKREVQPKMGEASEFQLYHWLCDGVSFKEYTYHFVWCCYAIVYGIKRYDTYRRNLEGRGGETCATE